MEKTINKKMEKTTLTESFCEDRLCPKHGKDKLKIRGRTFEGKVIRKHHKKITIQFDRMIKLSKYERFEKRKTKLHARLPDCEKENVNVGDLVEIVETRPISKMIHFVFSKIIKSGGNSK